MKRIRFASIGVALLLLGANAPGYAQEHAGTDDKPQHEQKKAQGEKAQPRQRARSQPQEQKEPQDQSTPPQQHARQRPAEQNQPPQGQKAQPRQPVARSQPQGQNPPPQQRAEQRPQSNPSAQQRRPVQQAERATVWQQHRATNWQSQHRTWQQRGGYSGYRIPDDRYRVYFGQNHGFRINVLPLVMVGGYPRFQYGGFWFSVVDPWPEYWSGNWYDSDDVYVDYSGDGYYLYNRRHPRDRLAISLYMQ
jgi:hypothetical protein